MDLVAFILNNIENPENLFPAAHIILSVRNEWVLLSGVS